MGQVRTLRTDDFTGGLNLRADPFQLGVNESPDLLNVDIDPRGGFSSRGGFQRYNTSAIGSISNGSFTPEKIYNWQNATPQLVVAANGKVYTASGTSFTDTTITTTSAEGASFAHWTTSSNSVLYVASGTGTSTMSKWDGSTKTSLTASGSGAWQDSLASPNGTHMPRADHCAVHVDRMWVASTYEGTTAYKNRVRFSHPNFPESWRDADYIDIVGGGNGITALVPYGGALLVFKANSVHAIYGYDTDTFQVVTLTESIGVPTSHCVAATERGLFLFHWPEGLFMFDGQGFVDMFEKLRPLVTLGELNSGAVGKIWLSQANSKIWLSLPVGTSATNPTATFVYDPTIRAWTRYQCSDGSGLACLTDFVASNGDRFYLALHPTNPFVLKVGTDTVQDNLTGTQVSFDSYYVSRWLDADVISAKKMWRRPDFVVKQSTTDFTLTIQVYHDWDESNARRNHIVLVKAGSSNALVWNAVGSEPDAILGWGEAPWGGNAEGAQFQRGFNLGLARAVQLRVTGERGKAWGVNSITYKYIPRRIR